MADADIPSVVRTFKFRLLPTRKQHRALMRILEEQRLLYNAALQERADCYRKTGKGRSYYDQCAALTELRREAEYSAVPMNLQRGTLARLNIAFQGFFRRVKSGEKPGFPRFKGQDWFTSFEFKEFCGITLHNGRLRFKGLPGGLRVHLHRPLPEGKPLSCKFKRDHKGWSVSFQMRVSAAAFPMTGRSVGIDMGIKELCVLSTGEAIPNPQKAKRAEQRQRRLHRALSRCKRASRGRVKAKERLQRFSAGVRNARRTYLHQVSAKLVRENDNIYIEHLNLKGLAGGMLAKDVRDAGWGMLRLMLEYKAESAGKRVVAVDPKNTSQECSGCGELVPKKLKQRTHNCPHCGLVMDRDENAARNILARGGTASRGAQLKAVA